MAAILFFFMENVKWGFSERRARARDVLVTSPNTLSK